MISVNCFNKTENLFIGGLKHISKIVGTDDEIIIDDIVNTIIDNCGVYKHHWEEGDMLVWDNVQVMHRAANDYEGARLLIRA